MSTSKRAEASAPPSTPASAPRRSGWLLISSSTGSSFSSPSTIAFSSIEACLLPPDDDGATLAVEPSGN